MAVYSSMFEKPCISTTKCKGIYSIQEVVDTNGTKEVIVVCDKCKKTTSKYKEL